MSRLRNSCLRARPTPRRCILIFAGANDLIGGQTNMTVPVNSLASSINRLMAAGARQFLVFNLPPLGSTPRYNGNSATRDQYNTRTQQFNTALATMLGGVQAGNPALTVYQLDVFGLFNRALADPAAFGLLNVTQRRRAGTRARRFVVRHQSNRA